ncbi:hypothetical protein CRUP_006386 [Coryphaenoides rupestris]|nr:hypothetical protein CRUP_006386 [Coryphaenoides rupestris]
MKTPFISSVVLANRVRLTVVLQGPNAVVQQLEIQRVTDFMQHLCERNVQTLVKHHHSAAPTMSGQSQPGPSVPVQSRAAVPISGPTPVAPANPGNLPQDQAEPVSSGTQPLSQEMFRFFATAIRQHRQAKEGQEVSRVGQEVSQEKENQQVSGELLKTSSTTSRRVESSSSTAARSSSSTEATVSSSSPSLPPPVRVVPSSSEQNTSQKKCEESPAQVSEAGATTYPTSASSQEVTRIPPTEEAESLPACQPITNEEPPRVAATECEGGLARLGHKMAAEASALKSAESQTGKDKLHTNPSLEEEGERKAIEAQQELTLSGQDMLIFPTEDTKKSRVEVDETNQLMGDGKIGDHMLHSGPECGQETSPETLVQSEMPTLLDPASQTPEPHEDKMLAKVAEEAEPVQEVPEDTETVLEEEKMTVVEEQRPSAHEETPTVVSDAAEIPPGTILNGTSTEVDDTHQLMDCVEASPPKEESNEEPTEEAQNSKDPTEEAQNSKDPTEERQNSKDPTEETQNSKEPTEEAQNSKEPTAMEANKKDEQGNKEEQSAKDFAGEKENIKEQQHSKELAEEEVAPDMEQRQSKRGHSSPAAKPPSTRRSTRSSTPAKKSESPAGNPVKVEVDEQVLDSVEEGSSSTMGDGNPPSGALMPQGQPKLEEDESDYQVVDSVECDVAEDEGIQISTRRPSTRGKRGRAPKQTAKNAREKKEQPTAPVPEEAKKDPVENLDSPTMTETQDQEATEPTYHIIDSVGGEPNMEEPSKKGEEPRGKERDAEKTEVAEKWQESGQGVSLEEVATYQVLDSVGEELPLVTKATKGRGRKTGERRGGKATNPPMMKDNQLSLKETMFEVLDVAEEAAEQPGRPRRGLAKKDPPPAREGKTSRHTTPEGAKQDQEEKEAHPSVGAQQTAAAKRRSGRRKNEEEVVVSGNSKIATKEGQQMVQDLKEEVYQVVDSIENKPLEEKEEHGNSSGPRRRSSRRRDPAPAKTRATRTPDKATQGKETLYQVVDSVGEEEEQVPEAPVRGKRGRKVTRSDANTEEQASKKKKTKEQSTAPKGDEDGGGERENVLVSLDEVSDEEEDYPNDSSSEEALRRQAVAKKMRREEEEESKVGAEMEGLVTLDEVGEEEQKEGEVEEESGITEEELQALVTLDEIVEEEQEGEEPALEEPLPPLPDDQSEAKQREEVSFVTVDEVGYEDQEEACCRRVRRSTRGGGQQATSKLSGQQAPPTPLHAALLLAGKPGAVLSDRGAEPMAESPAQDGEETAVGERREGRKASSKARRDEEGAEPKRVCSLSPSDYDYTMPPFPPNHPLEALPETPRGTIQEPIRRSCSWPRPQMTVAPPPARNKRQSFVDVTEDDTPPPHVRLHSPHVDHGPQSPSTLWGQVPNTTHSPWKHHWAPPADTAGRRERHQGQTCCGALDPVQGVCWEASLAVRRKEPMCSVVPGARERLGNRDTTRCHGSPAALSLRAAGK